MSTNITAIAFHGKRVIIGQKWPTIRPCIQDLLIIQVQVQRHSLLISIPKSKTLFLYNLTSTIMAIFKLKETASAIIKPKHFKSFFIFDSWILLQSSESIKSQPSRPYMLSLDNLSISFFNSQNPFQFIHNINISIGICFFFGVGELSNNGIWYRLLLLFWDF